MSDLKTFITLCSGRGSNFEALLKSYEKKELNAKPVGLISSSATAKAVQIAEEYGIKSFVLSQGNQLERNNFLIETIATLSPDFLVLAGYLKLVPTEIVKQFQGKILNIHPSLLPKHGGSGMYGIKVHQSVLDSKDRKTGATVHVVTDVYDEGPIILQEETEVRKSESAEELASRILAIEHDLFPRAINKFVKSLV